MTTESIHSHSPLASLYRPTRAPRSSPLAATPSRRASPISYRTTDPPSPIRRDFGLALDTMDDSDDEEGPVPQLSALAQALLQDSPLKGANFEEKKEPDSNALEERRRSPLSRYVASRKRITWSQSPEPEERATRTGSSLDTAQKHASREGSPELPINQELVTPAISRYSRRLFSGTQTRGEGVTSSGSSGDTYEDAGTKFATGSYASAVRPAPGAAGGLPPSATASAMRWKRPGRGLLGAVGGAPRRGPRRESDQNREDNPREGDIQARSSSSPEEAHVREQSNEIVSRSSNATPSREEQHTMGEQEPIPTISRRPRRASPETPSDNMKIDIYHSTTPEDKACMGQNNRTSPRSIERNKPSLLYRAAAIAAAAAAPQSNPKSDKENMPPPPPAFFRQPAQAISSYKRLDATFDEKPPVFQAPVSPIRSSNKPVDPMRISAEKRPLSIKTLNTPLRPAPPPPKMSMLQTVTATAGAATTTASQNARRNRSTVHINGKPYRRLDSIGKGGSCKVYKVMAENHKVFAMKKVTFHEQDGPAAIMGYKGEIDLLKRLAGEERVIRLFDYELNEEKQTLTMLMECGESDFANILTLRHGNEDSQLDVSFVRFYWREMLKCVDVVHHYNVIHSDLKPANFLLVRGKLKLIDFGIANAVAEDTVNVHRETQVGTLNYMSPEAIVDINASSGRPMASVGQPRLMKLGAPSDVWSLGCILYQMTYGRTPFYHLASMYQKIAAIPDPDHPIDFPSTGIGGVKVPRSLINTMRGCLERDKDKRPTIKDMLSAEDPFLNPDRPKQGVVDISEDMLRMLLENAVQQVERAGRPDQATLAVWAKDVYEKLEKRMDGQRAGYR